MSRTRDLPAAAARARYTGNTNGCAKPYTAREETLHEDARALALTRRVAPILATLLLVGYFVIDTIVVMTLTQPTRNPLGAAPASYGVAFSDATFHPRADDTITLSGWFMPNAASTRAVVAVHGFGLGGCRTCGFNGHVGEFAAGLQQREFNVLSFDLRGHGRSSDARYTFELREKRDVEGAVDWLLARGFRPGAIGVLGESLGGAASIFAAAEEPATGALVTDSAFADLNQVLEVEFPQRSGLPAFFLPGAYLMGRLITGEDLSTAGLANSRKTNVHPLHGAIECSSSKAQQQHAAEMKVLHKVSCTY